MGTVARSRYSGYGGGFAFHPEGDTKLPPSGERSLAQVCVIRSQRFLWEDDVAHGVLPEVKAQDAVSKLDESR